MLYWIEIRGLQTFQPQTRFVIKIKNQQKLALIQLGHKDVGSRNDEWIKMLCILKVSKINNKKGLVDIFTIVFVGSFCLF